MVFKPVDSIRDKKGMFVGRYANLPAETPPVAARGGLNLSGWEKAILNEFPCSAGLEKHPLIVGTGKFGDRSSPTSLRPLQDAL
ncbi:hypothetical protein FF011L_36430 [Roseimaritima multifibrata]|uniref:Uncharacterized protein n=1 Tax=Roseimaritima multifibrata TaxID=1930274 RepID=A0A517MIY6_9BACT|nr:hypothetical protein FF011L_36430 [Roseimaritima multifibrata]